LYGCTDNANFQKQAFLFALSSEKRRKAKR
jgi:hypothetical protein